MSGALFGGVDPGKVGAIAVLSETGAFVEIVPTPMVVGKTKKQTDYDLPEIRDVFVRLVTASGGRLHVTLEKLRQLPPMMGGSAANYARGQARAWEWMFVALGIPYQVVEPQRWQPVMLLGTSGPDMKQRSIVAAKRLWPSANLKRTERSKKADDGITDALLLAEFGRRIVMGELGRRT